MTKKKHRRSISRASIWRPQVAVAFHDRCWVTEDAVKELDGAKVAGERIRVEVQTAFACVADGIVTNFFRSPRVENHDATLLHAEILGRMQFFHCSIQVYRLNMSKPYESTVGVFEVQVI